MSGRKAIFRVNIVTGIEWSCQTADTNTVVDLITTHTPISAQSINSIVLRLPVYFFLYKGICCGYPFLK